MTNPPARRAQIALMNIDDLRGFLRDLRSHGYSAKRQGKRAIWKVYPISPLSAFYTCNVREIHVDRFRHLPRGKLILYDAPEWKIEIQIDYSKLFNADIVARHIYGK